MVYAPCPMPRATSGRPRREGTCMKFEKLSSELRDKIAGKSPEELRALAKEEGHDLFDEELEDIAGGRLERWCQLLLVLRPLR